MGAGACDVVLNPPSDGWAAGGGQIQMKILGTQTVVDTISITWEEYREYDKTPTQGVFYYTITKFRNLSYTNGNNSPGFDPLGGIGHLTLGNHTVDNSNWAQIAIAKANELGLLPERRPPLTAYPTRPAWVDMDVSVSVDPSTQAITIDEVNSITFIEIQGEIYTSLSYRIQETVRTPNGGTAPTEVVESSISAPSRGPASP